MCEFLVRQGVGELTCLHEGLRGYEGVKDA